jgi:hypothetical protein
VCDENEAHIVLYANEYCMFELYYLMKIELMQFLFSTQRQYGVYFTVHGNFERTKVNIKNEILWPSLSKIMLKVCVCLFLLITSTLVLLILCIDCVHNVLLYFC